MLRVILRTKDYDHITIGIYSKVDIKQILCLHDMYVSPLRVLCVRACV